MASIDLAHDVIVRWDGVDPDHIPLLREGGITAIVGETPNPGFAQTCSRAGITVNPATDLRFLSLEQLDRAAPNDPVVLVHGLWPGSNRPPAEQGTDYAVASASRQPWIDANLHWVAWLRALYPGRPAVLGYLPDANAGVSDERPVPFESLETALVEARAGGGNYILALDPRYRSALLAGDATARAAWRQLGRTANWLRANTALLDRPTVPAITLLVEHGEETAEIANLIFRQNGSPALEPLASPPAPNARDRRAVVAVNLHSGKPASAAQILAHARAGSTVVLDAGDESAWWRDAAGDPVLEEHDRDFFPLGQGRLVVYKERIYDPSSFALDVIDLIEHDRRAVRLFGAGTEVAALKRIAPDGPGKPQAALVVVNYGTSTTMHLLVRVHGSYNSARLLRPESASMQLQTSKRGNATEVMIPELRRTAIVVFE